MYSRHASQKSVYQRLTSVIVLFLFFSSLIPLGYMPGDVASGQPWVVSCPSYFGSLADPHLSHSDHSGHADLAENKSSHDGHSGGHDQSVGNQNCIFASLITVADVAGVALDSPSLIAPRLYSFAVILPVGIPTFS